MTPTPPFSHYLKALGAKFKSASCIFHSTNKSFDTDTAHSKSQHFYDDHFASVLNAWAITYDV